jgi:hypothetical protein
VSTAAAADVVVLVVGLYPGGQQGFMPNGEAEQAGQSARTLLASYNVHTNAVSMYSIGHSPSWTHAVIYWLLLQEGEGYDRTNITLPGLQPDLIKAIVGAGKPVVLVLVHGGPLALDDTALAVPAIVDAHYPGELVAMLWWRSCSETRGAVVCVWWGVWVCQRQWDTGSRLMLCAPACTLCERLTSWHFPMCV